MRKRKRTGGRFLQLHSWMLETAAWRDLTVGARAAYVEIKAKYNGTNNGSIGVGVRDLANLLAVSKSSAARYLSELEDHGFIIRATHTTFTTKRYQTEWLLTEARDDRTGEPPTKVFARWKKQKPVPNSGLSVPPEGLLQKSGTTVTHHRPTFGTADHRIAKKQSYPRDPYTSKPEGSGKTDRLRQDYRNDPLVNSVLAVFPQARLLSATVRDLSRD